MSKVNVTKVLVDLFNMDPDQLAHVLKSLAEYVADAAVLNYPSQQVETSGLNQAADKLSDAADLIEAEFATTTLERKA